MRIRCFSPLLLLFVVALLLSSLAIPYETPLCGTYSLQYAQKEFSIITPDGKQVIGAQIGSVYFDHRHLFATRHIQEKEGGQNKVTEYWGIDVASGDVTGPMTKGEFDAWYPTLGRGDSPIWISAGNRSALIDRWEELNPGQTYE